LLEPKGEIKPYKYMKMLFIVNMYANRLNQQHIYIRSKVFTYVRVHSTYTQFHMHVISHT